MSLFTISVAVLLTTVVQGSTAASYRCPGRYMLPKDRHYTHKAHNKVRGNVASGYTSHDDKHEFPKAGNMYKLKYHCKLESEAQDAVNEACVTGKFPADYTGNTYSVKGAGKNFNTGVPPNTTWFLTQSSFQLPEDNDMTYKEADEGALPFMRLVWGKTEAVGCGIRHGCGESQDTLYFACSYFPQPKLGKAVYFIGDGCSKCSEECEDGFLCAIPDCN